MGRFCLYHHALFAQQTFDRISGCMGPSRFLNMTGRPLRGRPVNVLETM
jgi:hypothetical protein